MDIFNNSSNPFYRFGQSTVPAKDKERGMGALHRQCLPPDEQRNQRTAKAEQLCDIVKCHSWYLQQLCYFIWSGTSEKVTDEIIETVPAN